MSFLSIFVTVEVRTERDTVANARIEGLEKSLHMPQNGYNTALWIFYVPFVLVEIPSNMIMSLPRVKPNLFLGCNMLVLGVVATCQGFTESYRGLLVLRFLMGIFEATLPAGEQNTRIDIKQTG